MTKDLIKRWQIVNQKLKEMEAEEISIRR